MTAAPALVPPVRVPPRAAPALPAGVPRWWPVGLLVLGALALAVGVAVLDATPVGVYADDSMYVILARSIATGQGYRALNLPGAPNATHFPPGYPLLLAMLWRAAPDFPGNLMLFKAANALFLAVAAVGTARFVRRRIAGERTALAAGALVAVSIPLLTLSSMLLSEMLFLALLLLLLPALEALVEEPATTLWRGAMLGACIGALMLVRTHAVVLVPAVALLLALRGRWRMAAVVAATAVACLVPWLLWSARYGGLLPAPLLGQYDSYLSWWLRGLREMGPDMIGGTLRRTTRDTVAMFAALFSPIKRSPSGLITIASLVIVAATGIRAIARRVPVTLLFLAGYLAIVALWPFPPSRFVWGVWPLLLMPLIAGAHVIIVALRSPRATTPARRGLAIAGLAALAWITLGHARYEARGVAGQWWGLVSRANAPHIVSAISWTLGNTAPTDLVASEDDGAIYLYTGRPTVPAGTFTARQYLADETPLQSMQAGLIPVLRAYPVHSVVVHSAIARIGAGWLAAQPTPLLTLRAESASGAAFTVPRR